MSQNWTPPPATGGQPPPNYLVWAILATLFCCLPGGIASIIFATQVNNKFAAGDIAGAEAASKNAKMWAMISAGIGILVWIIALVYWIVVIGLVASQNR